jgi:PAS domain S-box
MVWLGALSRHEETASFLATLLESISNAVFIIDHAGMIQEVNEAALQSTGYSKEELYQLHVCNLCACYDTPDEHCKQCFVTQQTTEPFEMQVATKSGRQYPMIARWILLPPGLPGGMALVLRDTSEERQERRELYHQTITNYVIQAQEDERKRVARDLHDGIGQSLYSVLVGLRILNDTPMAPAIKKHLTDVQQAVEQSMNEVKNLAAELRPSTLDDLGLVPALRSYLKRYEKNYGITTSLTVAGSKLRYDSLIETALYRICQEALTNAAKYSGTAKIEVQLQDKNDTLEMFIRDYGKGLNLRQVKNHKQGGLGLDGMSERAKLVGGKLDINTAHNEGTQIHVIIPHPRKVKI